MNTATIIGATGFIGSALNSYLNKLGIHVFSPSRDYQFDVNIDLGTVFYCAGSGDCKTNYENVLDANVILLQKILTYGKFDKLLYVSSTRVYMNGESSLENNNLTICSKDNRKLFNLTKLVSEELCRLSNKNVVIVRPSNVYGLALNSKLFLPQIIKNAILNNKIDMYVSPEYSKDYVSVDDLVHVMYHLSLFKTKQFDIFNIASGINVPAWKIANILKEKTGCEILWHDVDCNEKFPLTDIAYINSIVPHNYSDILADLSDMIDRFKNTFIS